VPPVSAT